MIIQNVVTELNTSTYTPIVIPFSDFVRPVSYFTDDESDFLEAVDDSGTGESTIPGTTKVNLRAMVNKSDGILLYAKASTGTPNLVVKIGLPESRG